MLNGKTINLRLIREADLEEMMQIPIHGEETFFSLYMRDEATFRSDMEKDGCWSPDEGCLLITDKQDRLLGDIGYFKPCPYSDVLEIFYHLFYPVSQRRGIMTEALQLLSAYLFAMRPIERLQIFTASANLASRRVAEKCGYLHEGTHRRALFNHGAYHDVEVYSLLREECKPLDDVLLDEEGGAQ